MKINEVKQQLQIDSANIRFYEKEGLIHPKRGANGYREYNAEDVVRLKKIIIFRKIGMSISEIREVLDGYQTLDVAIEKNIENLNRQIEELNGALEVSKLISKNISREFDEEYYWEVIQEKEAAGEKFVKIAKEYWEFEKPFLVYSMTHDMFIKESGEVEKYGVSLSIIKLIVGFIFAGGLFILLFKRGNVLVDRLLLEPWFLLIVVMPIVAILSRLMYFMLYKKYQHIETEEETQEKGILGDMMNIIGLITVVCFLAVGAPFLLVKYIVPFVIGKEVVCGVSYSRYLYFVWFLAVALFSSLLHYLYGVYGGDRMSKIGDGLKLLIPRREKRRITLYGIAILFIVFLIYASCFDMVTENGVVEHKVGVRKEYTWDDVAYYTMETRRSRAYYSVTMKDGKEFVCMGDNVNSWGFPNWNRSEKEKELCISLTKEFGKRGLELKSRNIGSFWSNEGWMIPFAEEILDLSGERWRYEN